MSWRSPTIWSMKERHLREKAYLHQVSFGTHFLHEIHTRQAGAHEQKIRLLLPRKSGKDNPEDPKNDLLLALRACCGRRNAQLSNLPSERRATPSTHVEIDTPPETTAELDATADTFGMRSHAQKISEHMCEHGSSSLLQVRVKAACLFFAPWALRSSLPSFACCEHTCHAWTAHGTPTYSILLLHAKKQALTCEGGATRDSGRTSTDR